MKERIFILILTLSGLFLAVGSCSVEETGVNNLSEKVSLGIHFKSLSVGMDIRIIITDAYTGEVLSNEYPAVLNADGYYPVSVLTGKRNFYVLANEPDRLTATLNQVDFQSQIEDIKIVRSDLPDKEITEDDSLFPFICKTTADVRIRTGTTSEGELSIDGGQSWTNRLNAKLERPAVKMNIYVDKDVSISADELIVKKVDLENIPEYSYYIGKPYDGNHVTETAYNGPDYTVVNGTKANLIINGRVYPEYLLRPHDDRSKAMIVVIYARFNGIDVVYRVPLRMDIGMENYDLPRNRNFSFVITISRIGDINYEPLLTCTVADWEDASAHVDIDGAVDWTGSWADGTTVLNNTAYIKNGAMVQYRFKLSKPLVVGTWAATITNPVDFEFDYSAGAVSRGGVDPDNEYTICIKPRRGISQGSNTTDFYITVHNGLENIELNITNGAPGEETRFRIIQTSD